MLNIYFRQEEIPQGDAHGRGEEKHGDDDDICERYSGMDGDPIM